MANKKEASLLLLTELLLRVDPSCKNKIQEKKIKREEKKTLSAYTPGPHGGIIDRVLKSLYIYTRSYCILYSVCKCEAAALRALTKLLLLCFC